MWTVTGARPDIDVSVPVTWCNKAVVQTALDGARRLQKEANDRLDRAGTATSEAARWLTKKLGLTLREAAEILGVSFPA